MTAASFDPRPLLARSMDQVGALILSTEPADAQLATPCEDYTVADLIGHLQAVVRRVGAIMSGQPFFSVPREIESTDWAADWAAGRAATDAVLGDDAALTRTVSVPWGEVPGASAAASYIGEFAVHAWDLAVATGRESSLDEEIAEVAYAAYVAKVPAQPRGGDIPFGPVVGVGAEAGPYERLVAWTGRNPAWRP